MLFRRGGGRGWGGLGAQAILSGADSQEKTATHHTQPLHPAPAAGQPEARVSMGWDAGAGRRESFLGRKGWVVSKALFPFCLRHQESTINTG